jgi:hypothetical protein
MYKVDIKTLRELKESLINSNEMLKRKTTKFSDLGSYVPSDVSRQITDNQKMIDLLEEKFFIK